MRKSLLAASLALGCMAARAQQISLQPAKAYPTQSAPLAVVTGDFNSDGKPDMAVANAGSPSVSVWLGNGDGTFRGPAVYDLPSTCAVNYLAVGDFKKDGKPDLLAACILGDMLLVLPGNGDGTFGTPIQTAFPLAVATGDLLEAFNVSPAIADFNGDGQLDLVVTMGDVSASTVGAYIALGNGDGTFGQPAPVAALATLRILGYATADFNRDGKPDLAAMAVTSTKPIVAELVVAIGHGDGTFTLDGTYPADVALDITAGDVNGDGITDLVLSGATNLNGGVNTTSGKVAVYIGSGTGTFSLAGTYSNPAVSGVFDICLADMRGTGRLDIVESVLGNFTSDLSTVDGTILVLPANADGTLGTPVPIYSVTGTPPLSLAAADFNRDGLPDLAFVTMSIASFKGLKIGDLSAGVSSSELAGLPAGNLEVMLSNPPPPPPPATFSDANAASFQRGSMAQDSIIAAFGSNLASTTATAETLSTSLGGVAVSVKDSAGITRSATLFYVSSTQVNYALPADTATGSATITVNNGSSNATATQQIVPVAPGLFAVSGIAAANVATYHGSTLVSFGDAFQVAADGTIAPTPIDLGSGAEQVYLLLYGTGIRHATAVAVNLGTLPAVPVAYAGPTGTYLGEDQVNVLLPAALKGAGLINVTLIAGGLQSNTVQIQIQ